MKNLYKKVSSVLLAATLLAGVAAKAQTVSNFDSLVLSANSYWNGAGPTVTGTFASSKATFSNNYSTAYGGYWVNGWIYSNKKDSTTVGYTNIASCRPASGAGSSNNYAIGTQDSKILVSTKDTVKAIYIANTTYAALSMANGDAFAKKFGGASGNDPDFFKLVIRGSLNGTPNTIDSVEFYLADYRDANNANDYIVKNWQLVDLTKLGKVDELNFTLSSSDAGQWGINTPLYYAIDNIIFPNDTTVADTANFESLSLFPNSYWKGANTTIGDNIVDGNAEFRNYYSTSSYGDYWSAGWALSNMTDSTTAGYTNMYSAITAKGYNGSGNYVVGQNGTIVNLFGAAKGKIAGGFYVTNSTYAHRSMQNGDGFAKKFGGVSGNDPDFFKLVVYGYLNSATRKADSIEFYLADYRDANSNNDYIINTWNYVDLQKLGNVDSLEFVLRSSDVGQYGMNTPAFFCVDNFTTLNASIGIANVSKGNNIAIYPNPVSTELFVNVNNTPFENAQVSLFNISGKQLFTGKLNGNAVYSTEGLQQGVYLLQIKAVNGLMHTQRIVKQ